MSILDDEDDGKKSDKGRRSSAPRITDNRTFAQRHPGWHRTLSILDAVSEPFVSGNYYNSQTGGWNSPGTVLRGMVPGLNMIDPNRPTFRQNVNNIFGTNFGRGTADLPAALPVSGLTLANGLPPAIPISPVEANPAQRPRNNGVTVSDIRPGSGRGSMPAMGWAPIYNPGGIRGNTALSGAAAQDWLRAMQMGRGAPIAPWLRMGTNAS